MEDISIIPSTLYTNGGIPPSLLEDILKKAYMNPYSIVSASTGSGKSTLIPAALTYFNARVFCAQPTKVAVLGLSEYIRSKDLGIGVGYQVGDEVYYKNSDKLVYCTTGHLKNLILGYFKEGKIINKKKFCDVIYLDEAHSSTVDNEIIMRLWAKWYEESDDCPRLLLGSATISLNELPFKTFNIENQNLVSIYEAPTKEVIIYYSNRNYKTYDKIIYKDLVNIILEFDKKIIYEKGKESKWLAFLPGVSEINFVEKELLNKSKNLIVKKIYSNMKKEEINANTEFSSTTNRVIFLSTNAAETSLTIDGLEGVFDTLLERLNIESSCGGVKLDIKHISKSSANQRKGRTGRTVEGFCYRMCKSDFFETLDEQRLSEIKRIPLFQSFLILLDKGINVNDIFGYKLTNYKILEILEYLKNKNLIDKDLNTTAKGSYVSDFYFISINSAICLWEWFKLYNKDKKSYPFFPILVLISIIENSDNGYYWFDIDDNKKAIFNNDFKRYIAKSNLEMYLKMVDDLIFKFRTLDTKIITKKLYNNINISKHFNNRAILDLFKILRKLYLLLNKSLDIELSRFDINNFLKVFNNNIIDKVYEKVILMKNKKYYIDTKGQLFLLSNNKHYNPFVEKNPPVVYIFNTFTTVNMKGTDKKYITFYHFKD